MRHVHRHLPRRRAHQRHLSLQDATLGNGLRSTICTHCSNGTTTLSVRNHEILRSNNRDLSGINGDFLCVKGRFRFDFTKHPERIEQPLVRKGDKLYIVVGRGLTRRDKTEADSRRQRTKYEIGFIGSNRTSNEENYLLQRLARATFGTNDIDHHRTVVVPVWSPPSASAPLIRC